MIYLAATIVIVAVLWFVDRAGARRNESARAAELERVGRDSAHTAFVERLLAEQRAETATLLQRIQAPVAAVTEHHAQVVPQERMSSLPMSDAEMAEQEERTRLISAIEAAENGKLPGGGGMFPAEVLS